MKNTFTYILIIIVLVLAGIGAFFAFPYFQYKMHLNSAHRLEKEKKYDMAIPEYEEAAKFSHFDTREPREGYDRVRKHHYMERGKLYFDKGDLREAYRNYSRASKVDPDDGDLRKIKDDTGLQLINKSLQEAGEHRKKMEYEKEKDNYLDILLIKPNDKEAKTLLDTAARNIDIRENLSEAKSSIKQEEYDVALEYYQIVLKMDPGNKEALDGSRKLKRYISVSKMTQDAESLADEGKYEAAIKKAREILAENHGDVKALRIIKESRESLAEAFVNKGDESTQNGRLKKASGFYKKALAIDGNNKAAKKGLKYTQLRLDIEYYTNLGDRHMEEGNFGTARENFMAVHRLDPKDPYIWNRISRAAISEKTDQWARRTLENLNYKYRGRFHQLFELDEQLSDGSRIHLSLNDGKVRSFRVFNLKVEANAGGRSFSSFTHDGMLFKRGPSWSLD